MYSLPGFYIYPSPYINSLLMYSKFTFSIFIIPLIYLLIQLSSIPVFQYYTSVLQYCIPITSPIIHLFSIRFILRISSFRFQTPCFHAACMLYFLVFLLNTLAPSSRWDSAPVNRSSLFSSHQPCSSRLSPMPTTANFHFSQLTFHCSLSTLLCIIFP